MGSHYACTLITSEDVYLPLAALACSKRWTENPIRLLICTAGRMETPPICLGEARLLQEDAVLVEAQLARAEQLRCNACQVATKGKISDVTFIPAKSAAAAFLSQSSNFL